MKVKIDTDYNQYLLLKNSHYAGYEVEIDDATCARWKQIIEEYEKVQLELAALWKEQDDKHRTF